VQDDRAAMLYDCELTPPVGRLRIASFFRVENRKIPGTKRLYGFAYVVQNLCMVISRVTRPPSGIRIAT